MMSIQTINPATEEVLETFETYSQAQTNEALQKAHQAFLQRRTTTFAERAKYLHRIAGYLRDHKGKLAQIAVLEMGKPIIEAEAEVVKGAWNCDFYADKLKKITYDVH